METFIKYISFFYVLFFVLSCDSNGTDEVDPEVTNLLLTVDKNIISNSGVDEVIFTVTKDGKDVTWLSKIQDTETGMEAKNGKFSTVKNGKYNFVATYGEAKSNSVIVTVGGDIYFTKNLLLTETTSVLCAPCYTMIKLIHNELLPNYPDRISCIALHSNLLGVDPMADKRYDDSWRRKFSITSIPDVRLEHHIKWDGKDYETIENILASPALQGIAITPILNNRELSVEIKIKVLEKPRNRVKLVIALTEDGIENYQNGANATISHTWVLRNFMTDMYGDLLEDGALDVDKELSKTYTTRLNSLWNLENMSIVAYLLDGETDEVINCRETKIKSKADYQYYNK